MTPSKFSRDDLITAGLALVLAIDLLFVPWWSETAGFGPFARSFSRSATGVPDGWLGVIGVLAALAVIADLALDRLGSAQLPSIARSRATTRFMLALAAAVCVAFKFLLHASFTIHHWEAGFWIAVIAAAALVAVMARALRAEGSVEQLLRPRQHP